MRRLAVVAVLLTGMIVSRAAAQRPSEEPLRPRLPDGADTNNPQTFYDFGVRRLRQNPNEAAAAFYWAMRLNPEDANYPYARWVALVIRQPELLGEPRRGTSERAVEARALDSLMTRSLMLDPFLHRRLEDQLVFELLMRSTGSTVGSDVDAYITRILPRLDPYLKATVNYSRGRFDDALDDWGQFARRNPRNAYVRLLMGRVYYQKARFDSAQANIASALEIARRREADSITYHFESKATWEYTLGKAHEQLGNAAAAREAYERALIEDLAYYPAHIQLGLLHMQRRDTAAAMTEFGRAIDGGGEDKYLPHATIAYFLANTRRLDSAAVHLRRAIQLEPHAATPRMMLGIVLETAGNNEGAVEAYTAFLARARRDDSDRIGVQARLARLRGR